MLQCTFQDSSHKVQRLASYSETKYSKTFKSMQHKILTHNLYIIVVGRPGIKKALKCKPSAQHTWQQIMISSLGEFSIVLIGCGMHGHQPAAIYWLMVMHLAIASMAMLCLLSRPHTPVLQFTLAN